VRRDKASSKEGNISTTIPHFLLWVLGDPLVPQKITKERETLVLQVAISLLLSLLSTLFFSSPFHVLDLTCSSPQIHHRFLSHTQLYQPSHPLTLQPCLMSTSMSKARLSSIPPESLRGKNVFLRVDFNVPLELQQKGSIVVKEDARIRAGDITIHTDSDFLYSYLDVNRSLSLFDTAEIPTITHLMQCGAKTILCSHLVCLYVYIEQYISQDHINIARSY
jgi:hypothetical protein